MRNDVWDREKLYAEVWKEPATKVASRYGVSDVAIAKACRKLNIPVPGRGYWAKKAHGYNVKQIPLPKLRDAPVVRRISIGALTNTGAVAVKPGFPSETEDRLEVERIDRLQSNGAMAVPTSNAGLRNQHLRTSRHNLRRGYRDHRGILHPPRTEPCLDIRVTKPSLKRALNIVRMLIYVIEKNGMKVVVTPSSNRYVRSYDSHFETALVVFNERVQFVLSEKFRHVREPLGSAGESIGVKPTGILSVRVVNDSAFFKRLWQDTEEAQLEQRIPEIVATMMKIGVECRRETLRRTQEERFRWIEMQQQEHFRRLQAAEDLRLRLLEEAANRWTRAKQIRDYVFALAKHCTSNGQKLTRRSALGKWVLWAFEQADRLDPLSSLQAQP